MIWQNLKKPFFVLAPMDAVTDTVFRRVIAKAAKPDLFFTEFTNATGWQKAGNKAIAGRLNFTADETPIIAHLWGVVPNDIEQTAKDAMAMGFSGVDLNMGCPAKHVIKHGACSALIHNHSLAGQLINSAKKSGLPVSVKTRLGIRENEVENWVTFLLEQGIDALTMHCRTQKEMSKAPAQWDNMAIIANLRDKIAPNTKIIVNGDIMDRRQGLEIVEKYSIDGAMIGRGVFHNPFCFEVQPKTHNKQELLALLKYHLDIFRNTWGEEAGKRRFEPLKKFFKVYVRDFDGANDLRSQMMTAHTLNEIEEILSNHNLVV